MCKCGAWHTVRLQAGHCSAISAICHVRERLSCNNHKLQAILKLSTATKSRKSLIYKRIRMDASIRFGGTTMKYRTPMYAQISNETVVATSGLHQERTYECSVGRACATHEVATRAREAASIAATTQGEYWYPPSTTDAPGENAGHK